MLLSTVRKKPRNNGFTLIEMIVTVIVAGILMAVAAPSLMGMLDQNRVRDGLRQVENAFKEAQRQAIRRGNSCQIVLNIATKTFTATPNECLQSQQYLTANEYQNVLLRTDDTDTAQVDITFSHRGTRLAGDPQRTIVFYRSENSLKRCMIITPGLGTIKNGIYTGNVGAGDTITANSCEIDS